MSPDIISTQELPSHQRYKGGRPTHKKSLLERSPPPTKEQMKGVVTPRRRKITTFTGETKVVKGVLRRTNRKTGEIENREVQYGGFETGGRYRGGETIQRNIQWYRQWFSWLKLSLSMEGEEVLGKKVKVRRGFYKKWSLSEIPDSYFDDWWKSHRHLFQSPKVELVSNSVKSDSDHFVLKIPKGRNHNEVVREVRDLLKGKMTGNTSKFPFKQNDTTPYLKIHQQWNILMLSRNGCSHGTIMNWMNDKYSHLYEDKMRELEKKGVVDVLPVVSTPQGLSRSLRRGRERIHRVSEGVFP